MDNDIDPLRFLTLRQAADMLQISPRTLVRLAQRKELSVFKVGGQWRARDSELAKWLERKL
jgi:excisionase family DNA binding protein